MRESRLELAFDGYCRKAQDHETAGQIDAAWACLEAGHIVGQTVVRLHVASHWRMLGLGWRSRDRREVIGQIARIAAALIFTRIWIPSGNRGRARVSAVAREPIPSDLEQIIDELRTSRR